MSRSRVVLCALGGAGFISLPSFAVAGEPSPAEPVAIAYSAADACPSEEEFLTIVRRYTTKWARTDEPAGVRRFQIRLVSHGEALTGALVITTPDAKTSSREITGADCETVAGAIAVAVALAIDPQARFDEPSPEADSRSMPVPAKPDVPRQPRTRASKVPAASPSRQRRWIFSVEARFEMTTAVTARLLPVFGAAFEARLHLDGAAPSWLAPSLAIGIRQSLPTTINVPSGSSEFLWTAATIRLCPVRFIAKRLELAPCAEVDVGVLRAEAHGLLDARTTVTPWFDRGASLRAAYRIGRRWVLGAGVLVSAPTSRRRFAVDNGELILQPPAIGLTAGLLAEFRL